LGGINNINNKITPVTNRVTGKPHPPQDKPEKDFKEVLEAVRSQHGVSLSKHAQARMMSRNIILDKNQMERLSTAVERARQKGIRDTLVLMDDNAFVINVKSTTIVTAANREALKDKVFTNIDGAVIV
jgi:flagellar operon protein